MTFPSTLRAGAFLALLAGACLLLASCEATFDTQDRAFCRKQQEVLARNFNKQIEMLSAAEKQLDAPIEAGEIPAGFAPWWAKDVDGNLFRNSVPTRKGLDDLLVLALRNSSQIKVFSDVPLIRETGIQEARGRFDTHVFAEAAYEYTNDPTGSLLTTGFAPGRFKQYETRAEAGVKKKLLTGADVAVSQRFARTGNNSVFFIPDKQATARLGLWINQPLLKGAGIEYNRSLIRIAKIDSQIARNEFIRQAESHLLEITRSYWNLYFSRSLCTQKRKLLADTTELVAQLAKRKGIDAMEDQLKRAQAAQAKRHADLVRVDMAIRNAEDRIKALINDPNFLPSSSAELVPADTPLYRRMEVDLKDTAATALENRPEIRQAFLQLKAAAIRREVSKNELLPQLDLILEMSIAGLDKAGSLTDGWDEQWEAHPSFLVGLEFDFPVENNVAKARDRRRRLEIRQQLAQVQTTVDTVLLEAKIAARELRTAARELDSRYASLQAATEDLRILQKRWESHAGGDAKPVVGYLQLLLDAQDRLANAQEAFSQTSAIYNVAMVNLQRAQGTLLTYEDIEIIEDEDEDDEGLPALRLIKKKAEATN
ncbi:MAG TPA: TolC family protein [Phycisphaerae bacterium]|nr:TolC family protein [Phycisphaerae bacterium]